MVNTGLLLDTPELRSFLASIAGLPVGNVPTQAEIDQQRTEIAATKQGVAPDPGQVDG